MNKLIGYPILLYTLLVTSACANVNSEELTENRRCLPMTQISQIEVVSDSTLVFHMRGNEKYINQLPYTCNGLKTYSFIHETSTNNYCDLDLITVVDTHLGMKLHSCPIGKFQLLETTNDRGE